MAKFIALRSGIIDGIYSSWRSSLSATLKQQALLFDQIGIFGLSHIYKVADSSRKNPEFPKGYLKNTLEPIIMELEWLTENDIVFEPTTEDEFHEQTISKYFSRVASRYSVEEVVKLSQKLIETGEVDITNIEENETGNLMKAQDMIILRLMALIMETTKGVTAVTTFPYTEYTREIPNSQKGEIAQVVISKLPLPSNETPWEQIIDYRNDPENQNNLLGLRQWIRKISNEELSKAEIEDEIEWRINEFQNHMKLHEMKANTETLEVIVKAPLEIIENLIKLKFSKIPEPFFAFKKRQINLMEAELNAPSREISYIIKTRESFQI